MISPDYVIREAVKPKLKEARCPSDRAYEIILAICEVIKNCRRHGHDKLVTISVEVTPAYVAVAVKAESHRRNFRRLSRKLERATEKEGCMFIPGDDCEDSRYGGMGLGIIAKTTDRAEFLPNGDLVLFFASGGETASFERIGGFAIKLIAKPLSLKVYT